jgi:TolB-like protein/tetratricopeptide (TPR) repeat protein
MSGAGVRLSWRVLQRGVGLRTYPVNGPSRPLAVIMMAALLAASAPADLGAQYPGVPPPPPCDVHVTGSVQGRNSASRQSDLSIGVISFQNTSRLPGVASLGPALMDVFVTALHGHNEVRVVATSRFGTEQIANTRAASDIAATLGSRYVFGATIGRSNSGQLSVTGKLLDTRDGTVAWNATVTAELSELPETMSRMSAEALSVVAGRPFASVRTAGVNERLSNSVVEHFLRGRYFANVNTADGYSAALAQFDSATSLDPTFAAGFANAALATASIVQWGWWNAREGEVNELVDRGLRDSDRSLRLDSANADAWIARGVLLTFKHPRSFAGARAAFTRAISYAPSSLRGHHWFGRALMQIGDYAGARREFSRALSTAPGDVGVLVDLAQLDRREGRFSAACSLLDSATSADPTYGQAYVLRALVRANRGQLRFAWADAETGSRMGWPLWGEAVGALVDAQARDTIRARTRVRELAKAASTGGIQGNDWTGEYYAIALAASGDRDAALDVLERHKSLGAHLWFALRDPAFAPLRKQRRFLALLAASSPLR